MKLKTNKIRYVLTFFVIAVFLLITMATDISNFLISSTNVTVAIKNCEEKPPVMGTLNITLLALDSLNNPLPGKFGRFYITHQKVRPDTCAFDVIYNVSHTFETGPDGTASYIGPDWIHDNSQDLWRVEAYMSDFTMVPGRQVMAKFYSQSEFNFTVKKQTPL